LEGTPIAGRSRGLLTLVEATQLSLARSQALNLAAGACLQAADARLARSTHTIAALEALRRRLYIADKGDRREPNTP
jgi:hypothetical protein